MDSEESQKLKRERLRFFVQLTERCTDVMMEMNSRELCTRYAGTASGGLDSYVFTYLSDRTLFLEVTARFDPKQQDFIDSHRFASHPTFETVLSKYTRVVKKPNPVHEKARPWDVATTMVMKVEALLPKFCSYSRRLLRREYAILQHIWQSYLDEKMEFDDMTGIPMVFDYQEIPNQKFFMPPGEVVEEISLQGKLIQRKIGLPETTLSYMTVEKLGPSLSYLLDLTCVAKRLPVGLSVRTAFKVFDQLICRLLQIHRFGVLHNGVCPQNIYFGRGMCYNVVYLNNFRAASLASSSSGAAASGGKPCLNMRVAKDPRFASLSMMRSSEMHPVDDFESAFYTLLACIGPGLPWDALLNSRPIDASGASDSDSATTVTTAPSSKASKKKAAHENSRHLYAAVRDAKSAFWDSNIHMERFIANMMHRLTDRESDLFPIIADILLDLYTKVKRLLNCFANSKNVAEFCAQLCRGGSQLQIYNDLRKPALMYFRFEEVPPLLNNPTDLQRQQSLKKGLPSTFAWNLSEWCFNYVEVRPLSARA
ncbi:hypothetical protein BOX15_Mlig010436g3 [Macrostomum lignano]|uniref:Protein kinase domain-containing protein n=1 Tax=Macrostomum lignano TaxID=282301 RepID=A0A267G6R7_9PLAT|nr:hypothetical protein BOX15_Mlig010436g3 [Macrostomum lignano]